MANLKARLDNVTWAQIVPPPAAVTGVCQVPGSKSLSNRALLLAAFAHGDTTLAGLLHSDDTQWCQDALQRLGIACTPDDKGGRGVRIQGCGGLPSRRAAELWLGDAGTLARFLPGMLAATPAGRWRLSGSQQLCRRPLAPLITVLRQLGGHLEVAPAGGLPLTVCGGGLGDGTLCMPGNVSSQYISGVLMAAAVARSNLTLTLQTTLVQPAYVAMTVACLQAFGADIRACADGRQWQVRPATLRGCHLQVEADTSTACYFWAVAAVTAGRIRITNVPVHCTQADLGFLPVLQAMGCQVHQGARGVTVVGPPTLRGHFTADLSALSDQAPTLAALAALADGPITLTGVAHIRHHESDRLAAMAEVLATLGGQVREHSDGLTITPVPLHGGLVRSHGDHRIAMAMALIGLRVPGVRIRTPGCVAKTCPNYFGLLQQLGIDVQFGRNS